MNGKPAAAGAMVKVVDGKPMELPNHSSDRDATWSRGVSRTSLGYKLHAIYSAAGNPTPDAFAITTLNVCEKQMTARMIKRLMAQWGGWGYLLGDAHYDASWLFEICHPYCLHCHTFDESFSHGLGRARLAA